MHDTSSVDAGSSVFVSERDSPAGARHSMLPREFLAIVVWTALADWLIFRTLGYCGPALFLLLAPCLFWCGKSEYPTGFTTLLLVALLWLVALRLFWSGSIAALVSGVALVFALAMSASGAPPLVLEGLVYAIRVMSDGASWLTSHRVPARSSESFLPRASVSSWLLPLIAAVAFGGIFVFANPDLFESVSIRLDRVFQHVRQWAEGISIWEVPFCVAALLVGAGLLRPVMPAFRIGAREPEQAPQVGNENVASLYAAFRNTLLTLIGLFAIYLVFEFVTLWKRDFPDGFYYAGYAHQGAAWLTFALALATGTLSMIFSGPMLIDRRLPWLRGMAWVWSAQNVLLAVAVYNRLMIYVGYNGMTRMRTVGFFGITLVVIGFLLVVYKIAKGRGFWWLIRAQLVALVLTMILFSVFPTDYVAHRYNASRVSDGYLHPSVMIAVKPIGDEGMIPLIDLMDVDDEMIRNGVIARLAEQQEQIRVWSESRPWHWTRFQLSTDRLAVLLLRHEERLRLYRQSKPERDAAIEAFRQYAMKWY